MKIRLVGDRLSTEFFRMAGIVGESPESPEDIVAAVERFIAEPDVAVVLVTSSFAAKLGEGFRPYLQRRRLPAVLRIPDRYHRQGAANQIREHLQRTLGIRL